MEGWTLHYGLMGAPFGSEQYFPGGSVLWRDMAGECVHGRWRAREDGLICFLYDPDVGEKCWEVFFDRDRVRARAGDWPAGLALEETSRERAPLDCPGPDLGV